MHSKQSVIKRSIVAEVIFTTHVKTAKSRYIGEKRSQRLKFAPKTLVSPRGRKRKVKLKPRKNHEGKSVSIRKCRKNPIKVMPSKIENIFERCPRKKKFVRFFLLLSLLFCLFLGTRNFKFRNFMFFFFVRCYDNKSAKWEEVLQKWWWWRL